jgi:NAD(P)-dependent dehydrogenase (short-subunit alcohol dehydrogenase family)
MSGIVLVTGAGRGIGAAIARGAGKRGYAVAVNYAHSADGANKVVEEIKKGGGKAIAIKADMTSEAEIVAMFETIDRALGRITHLVNNAGIIGERTATRAITEAAINRLMQTNVTAPFLCTREAVKRMSTESGGPGGAIVNIGSIAARLGGFPGFASYAASKAAIDGLTIALSKELGPQGIRINTVRPGLTQTDMLGIASGKDTVHEMAKTAVPYGGRVGQPEEIAAMVLWLLSDEASYVSGAICDVSAGR